MTVFLTVVLSFVVILAAVVAMGIGAMAARKPMRGSCGGIASSGCELCGGERGRATDD